MAETETQRLDRLNRNIARRRALVAVQSALQGGFTDQSTIVGLLGLAKDSDISLALKVNLIEQVGGGLVLVSDIKESMWREVEPGENEKEEKKVKLVAPVLPGCKCRNADQSNPLYWLFTGWEIDGILEVAKQLNSLGISVYLETNGENGNYRMKLPTWVEGELILGAEPTWKEITEEKDNVNHSNSTPTTETRDTVTESFYLFEQIQGEASPSPTQRP